MFSVTNMVTILPLTCVDLTKKLTLVSSNDWSTQNGQPKG